VDDTPAHVHGLAVEVREGPLRTEYVIGSDLVVHGERLAVFPIRASAPNDIAGTPADAVKIAAGRVMFAAEVQRVFGGHSGVWDVVPAALLVRHQPQRDEDNTWATWVAAVCGASGQTRQHWAHGAPLAGWTPAAVASLADPALHTPVVYELWA
jgi:hypothetical protein